MRVLRRGEDFVLLAVDRGLDVDLAFEAAALGAIGVVGMEGLRAGLPQAAVGLRGILSGSRGCGNRLGGRGPPRLWARQPPDSPRSCKS